MFQINDYVFYESGGICRVSDIQVAPLPNMPADRQYYILQSIHESNGVSFVPVDSQQVFLRPLMSRAEAEELLERMPYIATIRENQSKLLRAKYIEAMRTYDPVEWVRVIKTVYLRANEKISKTQRISETERNFSDTAKRYLHAELALALELPEKEMETYLTSYLSKTS